MGTDKLARLLGQRDVIAARIRREQAKARGQERKEDTRRKILAGAAVLARSEHDEAAKVELRALLGGFLTRDDDRALFDLPPLSREGGVVDAATEAVATNRQAA